MSISQAQREEIARMLGYPNLSPESSLNLGSPEYASPYAMWQPYAQLISRLARTDAGEEVALLGAESTLFAGLFTPSSIALTFSTPTSVATGVQLEMDANGQLLQYTTQANDTPATIAAQFGTIVRQNAAASAQFLPNVQGAKLNLYVRAMGADGNGFGVMVTSPDPSVLIAIAPISAAQFAYGMTSGGANPNGPRFTPEGSTQPIYGYVPIIRILEDDLINSRENLDMAKADTYVPRSDEMGARAALWRFYRREMADRLGVPLDPDIIGNRQRLTQRVV